MDCRAAPVDRWHRIAQLKNDDCSQLPTPCAHVRRGKACLLLLFVEFLAPVANVDVLILGVLGGINFHETLMHGMLSFLLIAGHLHVDLSALRKRFRTIGLMASACQQDLRVPAARRCDAGGSRFCLLSRDPKCRAVPPNSVQRLLPDSVRGRDGILAGAAAGREISGTIPGYWPFSLLVTGAVGAPLAVGAFGMQEGRREQVTRRNEGRGSVMRKVFVVAGAALWFAAGSAVAAQDPALWLDAPVNMGRVVNSGAVDTEPTLLVRREHDVLLLP